MWTELAILISTLVAYVAWQLTSITVSNYLCHSGIHDYPFDDEKRKLEFIESQPPLVVKEYAAQQIMLNLVAKNPVSVLDLVQAAVLDVVMLNILKQDIGYLRGLLTNEYTNSALVIKKYLTIIQSRSQMHWIFWHLYGFGGGNIYTLNSTAYVRNLLRNSQMFKELKHDITEEEKVTLLIEFAFFYLRTIPLLASIINQHKFDNNGEFNTTAYWVGKIRSKGMKCPRREQNLQFMAEIAALVVNFIS